MYHTTQGFTLIELLVVIVIIGILASVLVPAVLNARVRANDTAAQAVGRQVLTAMAVTEVGANTVASCVTSGRTVAVTAGSEVRSVGAAPPITDVTCSSTADDLTANVEYAGGSSATAILTIKK